MHSTSLNQAKENLKKEKEKFEALFQYASIGILVVDSSANIILVNDFLLNLFGYTIEEITQKKIEALIPGRYHQKHKIDRSNYLHNPQPRPMGAGRDLFALKKDGTEFPVEISLSNYNTADGNFSIAFVSDISKRKEIERDMLEQKEQLALINTQIDKLNNELEQKVALRTEQLSDAMAQLEVSKDELTNALSKEKELSDLKSRFVSMASHEFRTPLSTILSSASLLAKYTDTDDQEKRDRHINRIKSSVNNLTDILNEFLSLGRIEDGKIITHYSEFSIKECIDAVCSEMQVHTRAGQTINYTHQGEALVYLDPSLLRNIIINLLSNAIKFSSENKAIEVRSTVDSNNIELTVKDNGIGIAIDDQQHLFERFFRAANATNIQGTGLGLHIVSKYVELMDGQINYTSELEKGTSFMISFERLPK
jgi:PAS domain S-box-containing protein